MKNISVYLTGRETAKNFVNSALSEFQILIDLVKVKKKRKEEISTGKKRWEKTEKAPITSEISMQM
jgi:hypothetical protein